MSIDRCKQVRKIIDSHFAGAYEGVTGDEPEQDGVYVVVAKAATYQRAAEVRDSILASLKADGFAARAETSDYNDGGERRGVLKFRVEVGEIRAL